MGEGAGLLGRILTLLHLKVSRKIETRVISVRYEAREPLKVSTGQYIQGTVAVLYTELADPQLQGAQRCKQKDGIRRRIG